MKASRTEFKFNAANEVSTGTNVPSFLCSLCSFLCRKAMLYMRLDLASNATRVPSTQANQEYHFCWVIC